MLLWSISLGEILVGALLFLFSKKLARFSVFMIKLYQSLFINAIISVSKNKTKTKEDIGKADDFVKKTMEWSRKVQMVMYMILGIILILFGIFTLSILILSYFK